MANRALALAAASLLLACATFEPRVAVVRPLREPLAGPKVVAFLDTGDAKLSLPLGPARAGLGLHLEASGFEVRRFVNDDVPYGIETRGVYERCDDGFRFIWIEVELVDLQANRTVFTVRGEGGTEGCEIGMEPKSRKATYGTLYGDLAKQIAEAWARPQAQPLPSGTQL